MSNISKPYTFSPNTTISSSQVNANFDTIYNDFNGGISAVNLATDAVTTVKIADLNVTTAKIKDSAVTPAKRSGGFFIGQIAGASLGSTGNLAITGVGFQPKLVVFTVEPTNSATNSHTGSGAATATSQFAVMAHASGGGFSRVSSTTACFGWVGAATTTPTLLASFVSMNADGFTVNVGTASSTFPVGYICYG